MKPQLIRYRRPLAVLCAVLAVLLVRLPSAPRSLSGSPALAAARDLPGGIRLTASDVRTVRLRPPPAGALVRLPENATLAAPVRRGEPLTDLRLLGTALLAAHGPGLVAAPVRVPDRALAALVHPGDRVDVLPVPHDGLTAPGSAAPPTGPLVTAAPVLAVPPSDETTGALLLLAVTRPEATALAAAPHLTLTLHPPAP
ncbi:SAF domain-containing protein [Actinocorallia populi]|uniref:SAF domain-containing protein n=1 Tax=Actinocorallia populi TaxID=2079200 RepID=UPI000D096EB5|nr:SAF domain-containing protein [Actinocorallia populi]